MHKYVIYLSLVLSINTTVHADEMMIERMQSVVDEVSELRERYENEREKNNACTQERNEQKKVIKKVSSGEGYSYVVFEKNRKRLEALEKENAVLKKAEAKSEDKSLQNEIKKYKRENKRLNSSALILVEKNRSLIEQINKRKKANTLKNTSTSDKEVKQLQKSLQESQLMYKTLQEKKNVLDRTHSALLVKEASLKEELKAVKKTETKPSASNKDEEYKLLQARLKKSEDKSKRAQESSHLLQENLEQRLAIANKDLKNFKSVHKKYQSDMQDKKEKRQKKLTVISTRIEKLQKQNEELRLKAEEKCTVSNVKSSPKVDCKPVKVIKVCKDNNPFPKLMMKNEKVIKALDMEPEAVIEVNKSPSVFESKAKRIITQKASAYRMNKEAKVYDSVKGKEIDLWEEKTSFTSNESEGKWIKITGHFVDKKWKRSKKEMWVKAKDTIKR